ncbi:MAG: FlgD immunoglobulin-like domain containing protein [Calditrichia bacterium]
MQSNSTSIHWLFTFIFVIANNLFAQMPNKTALQATQHFNALQSSISTKNQVYAWLQNNGLADQSPFSFSGSSYPGSALSTVFASGVVWSGIVTNPAAGNPLRTGGQLYESATSEGWIETPGTTTSPPIAISSSDPRVRIYRIRRDWQQFFDGNGNPIEGLTEVRVEAAALFDISFSNVTPAQERQVLNQYKFDWENWPGDLGAPYYDLNNNGQWDPGVDEPGLDNAEQVIWFVCHDLATGPNAQVFGSEPVGLELQVTQWNRSATVNTANENAIFRRYRILNKSGYDIEQMYLSYFSDIEIGEFNNDLAGSDSSEQLVYVYNGTVIDVGTQGVGTPAFGVTLLQGPLSEAPGEQAQFDFRTRDGYRNIPMSSFTYRGGNSPSDEDIFSGQIAPGITPQRWYNWLRGYLPEPDTSIQIAQVYRSGPQAGEQTFFPLDGNPVVQLGDLDATGDNLSKEDRAVFLNSGPFTLANSDTQEVIYALVGGFNDEQEDNLSGLIAFRNNVSAIRESFGESAPRPGITYSIQPGSSSSNLQVYSDLNGFHASGVVKITCSALIGNDPGFSFQIYDDGQNGDTLAGDGVYSGSIDISNKKYPFEGRLTFTSGTEQLTFPAILQNLCLRPSPKLTNLRMLYENGLQDLYINQRENARLGFDIINEDFQNEISEIEFAELRLGQTSIVPEVIAAGDTLSNNDIFLDLVGNSISAVSYQYRLRFDGHFVIGRGAYPAVAWEPSPLWQRILDVGIIQGVEGTIEPTIVDINYLNGHTYEIDFYGTAADTSLRWRLTDLQNNRVKLDDQRILDQANNVFPIVDGIEWKVFKPEPGILTIGTGEVGIVEVAFAGNPLDSTDWDDGAPFSGNSVWQSLNSTNEYYVSTGPGLSDLSALERNIQYAVPDEYEIRFTSGGSYAVFGYENNMIAEVPFELWNIGFETPDDPTDDVRMIPILISASGTPTASWGWGSGIDPKFGLPSSDPVYFFDPADGSPGTTSYDDFAAQCLADGGPGNIYSTRAVDNFYADLHGSFSYAIGRTTYCDFSGAGTPPPAGTVIRYYTTKTSAPGDAARVIAPKIEGRPTEPIIPERFALKQNFPNPFNPSTKIQLDLPVDTAVKLEIFNTLGQRVRKLVSDDLEAGSHEFRWDGRGDNGGLVASGIYFYRVKAGVFNKSRRMLLLR